jgi:serine/threonine protein kinase
MTAELWQAPEVAERFEIRRRLGAGGMGVVYEAFDRQRGAAVALKFMVNVDPAALFRFKNEFRALADIRHPNLVQLFELLSVDEQWFFTMELVTGQHFLSWVRPGGDPDAGEGSHVSSAPVSSRSQGSNEATTPTAAMPSQTRRGMPGGARGQLEEARLRQALRQLALGLHDLHRHERLHLDVKPSNVLVEPSGRVALCDFGLSRRIVGGESGETEDRIIGTVSHMAPEQAAGGKLTEACDWYSVGVVLFQALTGQLPFIGERRDVLLRKQIMEPSPVREIAPDAPEDLAELAGRLLRLQPEERASGAQVLQALGVTVKPASRTLQSTRWGKFVGRSQELATLRSALAESRTRGQVVLLEGPSGSGKSALLEHFAAVARSEDAVVLSGRCYEEESLPFKAFDSLVDGLSTHLLGVPRQTVDELIPRDVAALARLFPVLRRVRSIAAPPTPSLAARDPQESRRRAFVALRELLANLAQRRALVLIIDDLTWGDHDSALLLRELMRQPGAPQLLMIGTYRDDEVGQSAMLAGLSLGQGNAELPITTIRLDPLSAGEATALARELLSGKAALAEEIARESAGNPYFVAELVRHVESGQALDEAAGPGSLRLDDVVAARLAPLPEPCRELLTAIAVAGRPVPVDVAFRAAQLDEAERRRALVTLRVDHLARVLGQRKTREEVETYHDRVRLAVVSRLAPEALADWHRRLALAAESVGEADPERMLAHWRAAGDQVRAGGYAAQAAVRAAEALAFDRAVQLFRLALTLGKPAPAEARQLQAGLADALAAAGRGAEAAEAYVVAAEGANAAEALELRRRAAVQWLYTGHFDRGLEAIRDVLKPVGLSLAPTPTRALLSLLSRRALVRILGLRFKTRDPSQISAERLSQIDILWSVATGLSMIDTIRGADFQARHLRMSLATGEAMRVARSLAMEAAYAATAGSKAGKRADTLYARARAMAESIGDPQILGFTQLVRGVTCFLRFQWPDALEHCTKAEQMFRDHCVGMHWELTNAQVYALSTLGYMGDLPRMGEQLPARVREAEDRGNLYMINWLAAGVSTYLLLARDQVAGAHAQTDEAHRRWSHPGFHVQHYFILWAQCQVALYSGDADHGLELVQQKWKALARSQLLRVQYVRAQALHLRGRCILASSRHHKDLSRLGEVERYARRIAGEDTNFTTGLASALRAAVHAQRGRKSGVIDELERAERCFRAGHMRLFASASAYQLARALDDSARVAAAEAELAALGVIRPDHMADALITAVHPRD